MPELADEQQVDVKELKAKLASASSEVSELRTKLAIAEEVNLNFRKAFSSFEEVIQAKFESAREGGKELSEEDIRSALDARQQIAVSPHFRISGTEEIRDTCFVLMPFREEFNEFYHIIREVLKRLGVKAIRADELATPGLITDQIAEQIARAEFALADVTGQNPNVMYEIGIANALGKKVVMISQRDERIPFDVSIQRVLFYELSMVGVRRFQHELEMTIIRIREETN